MQEIMKWLQQLSPTESKKWEETMLDHSFGSEEWEIARNALHKLLTEDNRTATEAATRSYLACCAESVGSVHPLPDLAEIVGEFYQQYGMENSIPEK